MTNVERDREIRRLLRLEEANTRRLRMLEEIVEHQGALIRRILRHLHHASRPAAGTLTATFSGDSMNASLIASPPSLRKDGSALAPTDIASITFLKQSGGAGTPSTLVTNVVADPTVGLTLDQLAASDTSSSPGDAYTFFVTDTNGQAGDSSNVVTNPVVVVTPAPPAAGSLTGTFT